MEGEGDEKSDDSEYDEEEVEREDSIDNSMKEETCSTHKHSLFILGSKMQTMSLGSVKAMNFGKWLFAAKVTLHDIDTRN